MLYEEEYLALLVDLASKKPRETRNAETKAAFGVQMTLTELTRGMFPILQGRQIYWKGIIGELAAFLKGPKNLKSFTDQGCNYWEPWAKKGKLTVDYGNAWIDFNGTNQLKQVVESLKKDPNGRRHLITGWRPDKLDKLSLPCCHYAYQWFVNDGQLDMVWIQRSVDTFIGLPSDVILAAAFNILMANTVGLTPGNLTFQLGDTHLYTDHMPAVNAYLNQVSKFRATSTPSWTLDKTATVFNFKPAMLRVIHYDHMPPIKTEVIA